MSKILFVISSLNGGNGRILTDVAINQSKKNKIIIHILTNDCSASLLRELSHNNNISINVPKENNLKLIRLYKFIKKYKKYKFKIILSFDALSNLFCYSINIFLKSKWYSSIHGLEGVFTSKWFLINSIILPKSTKCIVVSKAVKNKVLKLKLLKPNLILQIYNGVKVQKKMPVRTFKKKYDICMIANFYSTRVKGHYIAINAIQMLPSKYKLYIYGSGKYFSEVEQYIVDKKLTERVILCGSVDQKKIKKDILSMTCLVVPSSTESFGLSIVESMSLSVPAIANKVGGIPEIIDHKVNGILVKDLNPKKLANEIIKLTGNPSENIRLGKSAHMKVKERFNKSIMLSKYDRIISL